MKTYYGYIRVSTTKQGEHGVSLEQQRDAIERYASKNNLTLSEWFTEQETAAKRGRPVFGQMLRKLKKGEAAGVVIHKIDRSARNLRDWADLGEMIDSGVEVHFANESLDLNSRGGRLSADIQAVVASDFIRNLREETKKGFYGRLKQGLYPMPAVVGYMDQGPGKPKLRDPVMAPLVRKAFELYKTGNYSVRALADLMFEQGLRTSQGKRVAFSPLAVVLSNPFYIGMIRLRKTGESFHGVHEPIIPTELFKRVQEVLSGKAHHLSLKHDLLFRGLFRCKDCGHAFIGEVQKGQVYYRCHTIGCLARTLPEKAVDAAIVRELKKLEFTQDEKDCFRTKLTTLTQNWQIQQQTQIAGIELHISQLQNRVNRLTDLYIDQALDRQSFEERKTALIAERCQLEEQLAKIKNETKPFPVQLRETVEFAGTAYLAYKLGAKSEKREMVKLLGSSRIVDGNNVVFAMRNPFLQVANRYFVLSGDPGRSRGRDVERVWDELICCLLNFGSLNEMADAA